MSVSRPVIAFALLRQCSELMQTDLLSGVAVLVRPLVSDLAGQIYDARILATRMEAAYGVSLPVAALEDFARRLVSAQVLRVEGEGSLAKAVYCHQEDSPIPESDEKEFQEIIDAFLIHANRLLSKSGVTISPDKLTEEFLHHLATLDFTAIRAKPIVKQEAGKTIVGPAMKEQLALSEELAQPAAIDALVASFITGLQEHSETQLALLAKVADGALGAELVFDLQAPSAVHRLTNSTVIVDTPLLLSFLDLSSVQDSKDTKVLFSQVLQAGAKIAVFQHSIEEAEGVLRAIQAARGAGDAYGPAVFRLSNSVYRAFFESMQGNVARVWSQDHHFEIIQETATHYHKNFSGQDEDDLFDAIRLSPVDRVLTRERDAKSVAETVRRLGGAHVPISSISSCKFIFATSNSALRRIAAKFLRDRGFVRDGEFSPVITSRYLAGLCWLIGGGKSDHSPTIARLLSNCAAALRLRPELADRTKRFLAAVDPEKAKHFEVLMTNERASQYLIESTFGNPDLITANNVEEIFDEVQRRAAEKVAREKDDFYQERLQELTEKNIKAEQAQASLQEQVAAVRLESESRKLQVDELERREEELVRKSAEQEADSAQQRAKIADLDASLTKLSSSAQLMQAQLNRQKAAVIKVAADYADGRVKVFRWMGVIGLFAFTVALSAADKAIVPRLAVEYQTIGTWAILVAQGLLGISGASLLIEPLVRKPLAALRERLYRRRLTQLGLDSES